MNFDIRQKSMQTLAGMSFNFYVRASHANIKRERTIPMEIGSGFGYSFSKPSRSEEAWSFANAKVPKLNASEWSRWNRMSVFAGNARYHCLSNGESWGSLYPESF
jgi:hypothetical protein